MRSNQKGFAKKSLAALACPFGQAPVSPANLNSSERGAPALAMKMQSTIVVDGVSRVRNEVSDRPRHVDGDAPGVLLRSRVRQMPGGTNLKSFALLLGLLVVLTAFARPCFASAYASADMIMDMDLLSFTNLFTGLTGRMPPGLVISCYGDTAPAGPGPGGVFDCANFLKVGAGPIGPEGYSASSAGGVVVTNTSDLTIEGSLTSEVGFVGKASVGVDNPATQYAVFTLTQSGPRTQYSLGAEIYYSCSAGAGPLLDDGCFVGRNAQGEIDRAELVPVQGPSQTQVGVELDLPPGASMLMPAFTNSFTVRYVPEPASLPLLGSGLFLFALLTFRPAWLFAHRSSRPSPDA